MFHPQTFNSDYSDFVFNEGREPSALVISEGVFFELETRCLPIPIMINLALTPGTYFFTGGSGRWLEEKFMERIEPLRIFVDTFYELEVHQISQYVSVTVDYTYSRQRREKIIDGLTYVAEFFEWVRDDSEPRIGLLDILTGDRTDGVTHWIDPNDKSEFPHGIPGELADTIAADIARAGAYIRQMQGEKGQANDAN